MLEICQVIPNSAGNPFRMGYIYSIPPLTVYATACNSRLIKLYRKHILYEREPESRTYGLFTGKGTSMKCLITGYDGYIGRTS